MVEGDGLVVLEEEDLDGDLEDAPSHALNFERVLCHGFNLN